MRDIPPSANRLNLKIPGSLNRRILRFTYKLVIFTRTKRAMRIVNDSFTVRYPPPINSCAKLSQRAARQQIVSKKR
jgi:hypothetical protein